MSRLLPIGVKPVILMVGILLAGAGLPPAHAAKPQPEGFAAPEQAVAALIGAARDNDAAELLKIFGPSGGDLVSSGDPVADREARSHFAERYAQASKIVPDGADKATLVIGAEEWPFPIPLVRRLGKWQFDTKAGGREILTRRIGRNELNAMDVCRSYVQAQRDYAAERGGAPGQTEYAQKFISTEGQHDGLYWPAQAGEKESPIGPLMASARAEGYAKPDAQGQVQHAPYHGYFYKILTRQGPAAPGGARDYIAGGHMTGGFALIAFPAKYRDSGVMTFIISQDGVVFEKDLGRDTATIAAGMTEFNPDRSWKTPAIIGDR
jgi:hypothetical protein